MKTETKGAIVGSVGMLGVIGMVLYVVGAGLFSWLAFAAVVALIPFIIDCGTLETGTRNTQY